LHSFCPWSGPSVRPDIRILSRNFSCWPSVCLPWEALLPHLVGVERKVRTCSVSDLFVVFVPPVSVLLPTVMDLVVTLGVLFQAPTYSVLADCLRLTYSCGYIPLPWFCLTRFFFLLRVMASLSPVHLPAFSAVRYPPFKRDMHPRFPHG